MLIIIIRLSGNAAGIEKEILVPKMSKIQNTGCKINNSILLVDNYRTNTMIPISDKNRHTVVEISSESKNLAINMPPNNAFEMIFFELDRKLGPLGFS